MDRRPKIGVILDGDKRRVVRATGCTEGFPGTVIWEHEEATWNVTAINRLTSKGFFGETLLLEVAQAVYACRNCPVDEAKVSRLMGIPAALAEPLIGVFHPEGFLLVDGQHRLRALHRLGRTHVETYGVPEDAEHFFRMKLEIMA